MSAADRLTREWELLQDAIEELPLTKSHAGRPWVDRRRPRPEAEQLTESTAVRIADSLERIAYATEERLRLELRDREREAWRKLDAMAKRDAEDSNLRVVR